MPKSYLTLSMSIYVSVRDREESPGTSPESSLFPVPFQHLLCLMSNACAVFETGTKIPICFFLSLKCRFLNRGLWSIKPFGV